MYFSENLRFLRQLRRGMTQENLAEQMGVSRQTVSKWESGAAYPELDKLIELCQYFNCSMDAMLCEAMNKLNDAYSNLRVETIAAFQYVRYTVISREPEHDAIRRIRSWLMRISFARLWSLDGTFRFYRRSKSAYIICMDIPPHACCRRIFACRKKRTPKSFLKRSRSMRRLP